MRVNGGKGTSSRTLSADDAAAYLSRNSSSCGSTVRTLRACMASACESPSDESESSLPSDELDDEESASLPLREEGAWSGPLAPVLRRLRGRGGADVAAIAPASFRAVVFFAPAVTDGPPPAAAAAAASMEFCRLSR